MPKIIISYRRSDSDVFAGRIRDRLAGRYGDAAVFMDIDDIPFGIDFRQHIKGALAASDVVIAIIGSRWLGVGKSGNARIQDEADPVRIEVEAALQNGIPVIPVLVGDTKMPKPAQLPETLKDFAFLNAATVDTGRDFHPHMERLLRSIDHILGDAKNEEQPGSTKEAARTERMPERASRRNQPVTILTIGVLVVVLGIGLVQFLPSVLAPKVEPSPPAPQTTLRLPTPTPQQVAPAPASQQVAPTPASQQLAATPPGLPALPVIPAEGLSFSCQDARSPVEVVICGDAELARKDRLLTELAEFLKGRRPSDEKLKSEHAAWQGAEAPVFWLASTMPTMCRSPN
jgi:TIR domain